MARVHDTAPGRWHLDPNDLPDLDLPESVWPQRAKTAYTMPGAGRFSAHLDLKDAVFVVEQLMQCEELWPDLERGTTEQHTYEKRHSGSKHVVGEDRMEGHWFPIFVAFKLSKIQLPTSWWDTQRRNTALWEAAGFSRIPSRTTTWERLTEMQRFVPAVDEATRKCWELVRTVLPDAGRHWIVDGTAFEEHVRLHHACPDKDLCAARGGDRMPEFLKREPLKLVEDLRKEMHDLTPDETHERFVDVFEEPSDDLEEDERLEIELDSTHPLHPKYERRRYERVERKGRYIWISGHRYWVRSEDTGYRMMKKQGGRQITTWLGGRQFARRTRCSASSSRRCRSRRTSTRQMPGPTCSSTARR